MELILMDRTFCEQLITHCAALQGDPMVALLISSGADLELECLKPEELFFEAVPSGES